MIGCEKMDFIVILLLIFAFILAFGIGSNDETMAPVVGARALSIKTALILGGLLSFAGCYFLSEFLYFLFYFQ